MRKASSRQSRVPVQLQNSTGECGAACLAMILSAHGHSITVQEIRTRVGVGRDGSTAAALAETAQEFGMEVSAYRAEPHALKRLPMPQLVHWGLSHFVVLEHIDEGNAVIVDPGAGRRRISRTEFDQHFTGIVLVMSPGPRFQRRSRPRTDHLRFIARFMPRRPELIASTIGVSVLLALIGLAPALITRYLLDRILPTGDTDLLTVLGLGVVALVVGQALMGYLRSELLLRLRTRIDLDLMTSFLRHLFRLPYPYFQMRTSGDILTRVSSGLMVREVLTSHTLSLVLDGGLTILYVALLWALAPPIGGLVFGAAVLQIFVAVGFAARMREASREEIGAMSMAQTQLVESLIGVETVKAAGAERATLSRWENLYRRQLGATLRQSSLGNLMEGLLDLIRLATPLLLLWTGAWLVISGQMTLGTLIGASTLASMALAPIASLSQIYQSLQTVGVHVQRLRDVLDETVEQPTPRRTADRLEGRITLESVRFRYQPDGPATIDGVSLDVAAGSFVAVVGRSGSGKSTLARLMLGLYQPQDGLVLLDGQPLNELDLESVRRQMGVVVQDNALFGGDVLENIRINTPDADIEDVVRAARAACLHAEIQNMPMGYFTPLGERGSGLSGGQRQRLALARALVGQPRIVLMDEATSHLDALTEARIQENLSAMLCTRIVIAHRLSTIREADLIVVVDGGEIVECGTHDELLALGGLYSDLLFAQLHGTVDGEAAPDTDHPSRSEAVTGHP
ncbi:peptidase domain-containing ABC transporter [Streptosporangium roseum]|uniref:peptidase domain-containing ABC transporter n=1 Tax=Streptosporangium roseum TaxID=2001 RepID=UPI00331C03F1